MEHAAIPWIIETIWHYCAENKLFSDITRDRFDKHIIPAVQRGESLSDIAFHIRCHGRITGKSAMEIQKDLEIRLKDGDEDADQGGLLPAT